MSNKEPRSILDKFYAQQTTDAMMEKIQDAEFWYYLIILQANNHGYLTYLTYLTYFTYINT